MADRLNELRGVGYGSRFCVSGSTLPQGWRRERRGEKYTVWYDSTGKRYKSSREVESALQDFRECEVPADGYRAEGDTATKTGGETSEFEPSPVKRPRFNA